MKLLPENDGECPEFSPIEVFQVLLEAEESLAPNEFPVISPIFKVEFQLPSEDEERLAPKDELLPPELEDPILELDEEESIFLEPLPENPDELEPPELVEGVEDD